MTGGRRQPLARAMREFAQLRLETGRAVSLDEARDRVERHLTTRREFLRYGSAFGAAVALAACTRSSSTSAGPASTGASVPSGGEGPHVVVVGAGLAGITAAYRLSQVGINCELYEARDRVGGRCWTARGFDQGQTAEHGGEFIDTRHVHILGLAKELGLDAEDLWEGYPPGSSWPNWVDGRVLTGGEVQDQLAPIVDAVTKEAKRIGALKGSGPATSAAYTYGKATPAAVELDQQTMTKWLDQSAPGVVGSPLGTYLNEVMAAWYGLDMDGLSAVNWIDYFVIPYKGADERWHIKGGNDQITTLASHRLPDGSLHTGTALNALRRTDAGYELTFDGMTHPVQADFVILATPFTTLRQVDLSASGFGAQRMDAISTLAMGADVKLLLQYDRRPFTFHVDSRVWSGGMEHTDPNFETWESSTDQKGSAGLITVYAGGSTAMSWSADQPHGPGPEPLVTATVGQIDDVVPGTSAHFNGNAWLDLWTKDPWTLGSYAAFGPGQMTKFWGYPKLPEGNVHFAGEHTSTYSQGFLNGGVESGQRAAIEVMRAVGVKVPHEIASLPYS